MESSWASRVLVGGSGSQEAGKGRWVGWPNVYVAENYVYDVAGDGIVLINADGGIAEKNAPARTGITAETLRMRLFGCGTAIM